MHRYNAEGLAGLANRGAPARPGRLSPAAMAEVVAWVEAGPDLGPVDIYLSHRMVAARVTTAR